MISEQLITLQKGQITDEELEQTKAMLKNSYLLSLDSPQALIEADYLDNWLPESVMDDETFLRCIDEVTVAQVQKVAQSIQLQAIYFLEGEGANA